MFSAQDKTLSYLKGMAGRTLLMIIPIQFLHKISDNIVIKIFIAMSLTYRYIFYQITRFRASFSKKSFCCYYEEKLSDWNITWYTACSTQLLCWHQDSPLTKATSGISVNKNKSIKRSFSWQRLLMYWWLLLKARIKLKKWAYDQRVREPLRVN